MNVNIAASDMSDARALPRRYTKVAAAAATPEPWSRRTVLQLTRVPAVAGATAATVQCLVSAAHDLKVGDWVQIMGAAQPLYNGTWEVESIPGGSTFTFSILPGADGSWPVSPATGTITCDALISFRKATLTGYRTQRTVNTSTVFVGPTSGNDTQSLTVASATTRELVAPVGCSYNLRDWYLDVITANDGLVMELM